MTKRPWPQNVRGEKMSRDKMSRATKHPLRQKCRTQNILLTLKNINNVTIQLSLEEFALGLTCN
jgi:hypothetical protein